MSENTQNPAGTEPASASSAATVPHDDPPRPPFPAADPALVARKAPPKWLLPVATGVVGILIGSGLTATVMGAQRAAADQAAIAAEEAAVAAAEAAKSSLFEDATRMCGAGEVTDEGRTLVADSEGEDVGSGDISLSALNCLLLRVGVPSSAKEKMYQTRSLDGRQTADWDDVEASWSYHPDDGLDIVFELVD